MPVQKVQEKNMITRSKSRSNVVEKLHDTFKSSASRYRSLSNYRRPNILKDITNLEALCNNYKAKPKSIPTPIATSKPKDYSYVFVKVKDIKKSDFKFMDSKKTRLSLSDSNNVLLLSKKPPGLCKSLSNLSMDESDDANSSASCESLEASIHEMCLPFITDMDEMQRTIDFIDFINSNSFNEKSSVLNDSDNQRIKILASELKNFTQNLLLSHLLECDDMDRFNLNSVIKSELDKNEFLMLYDDINKIIRKEAS